VHECALAWHLGASCLVVGELGLHGWRYGAVRHTGTVWTTVRRLSPQFGFGRVAQAFDFAGITTEWVPRPSRSLRRAGHGNAGACGLIPSLRNKSYSTGIIDAHPCKKRKDGAPSVEMPHIEIETVKRGPPAQECPDFEHHEVWGSRFVVAH
jgi:hypothetical protein